MEKKDLSKLNGSGSKKNSEKIQNNKNSQLVEMAAEQFARLFWKQVMFKKTDYKKLKPP